MNQLSICVIFATTGRPHVLASSLRAMDAQSLKPDLVLISCIGPNDVPALADRVDIIVVRGKPGLPAQRNTALRHVPEGTDVIVFLDDDFIAHPMWLAEAVDIFRHNPEVACVTGTVVADGIKGPGLSEAQALRALDCAKVIEGTGIHTYSPYGCNMAYRAESIRGLWFDERLVLYGWQEDRDFGGQVARRGGRLVRSPRALGVHLGVKTGRVPGVRLGYSQVANPLYLWGKGTMDTASVARHVFGNLAANALRSLWAEPYVDRIGRLRGNLLGIVDLVSGRLRPERAAQL